MRPLEALTKRGQVGRLRALARAALPAWGLAGAELRLLGHGENTTFEVRAPRGRFMLRVARPGYRTDAELASEVVFLEHLAARWDGGQAPRPVRTDAGEAFVWAEAPGVAEPRRCMLFGWLGGRMCWKSLDEAKMRALGVAQASLHDVLGGFDPGDGFTRPRGTAAGGYPVGWWREVDDFDAPLLETIETAHALAHPIYESLMATDGAYGLIHMDMHPWNVLFGAGNSVAIIDFDDAMVAPLIMDVVVVAESTEQHPNAPALFEAFVEGYRLERALPQEWIDVIPALLAQFYVNGLAWLRGRREIPKLRARYEEYLPNVRGEVEGALERAFKGSFERGRLLTHASTPAAAPGYGPGT